MAADHEADVLKFARLYTAEQWLQPRSLVEVQLAKLKEETRCPMCFGKIRSARISMVCLHRYCAKCIEQYLRAKVPGRHGDDKECPVCRAHLHSRRATKPDPGFDKIIKALYGDVDQYDAEEEALIAADNKRHVAQWQAQLADMKARQAAAVAAARSGSTALGAALMERRSTAAAAAAARDEARSAALGHGAADRDGDESSEEEERGLGLGGRASLGSRKRSWADLHDDEQLAPASASRGRGRGRGRGRASSQKAAAAAAAQGPADEDGDADAALALTALQQRQSGVKRVKLEPGSAAAALQARSGSSAGKQHKKRSAAEVAARLLGLAARAAAAAGPPARCCLVRFVPAIRPPTAEPPAAGGGGRKGRGFGGGGSSSSAALLQQQAAAAAAAAAQAGGGNELYACPPVDQPYLACPLELTVAGLKRLLLQQLRQQSLSGAGAPPLPEQLQLLLPSGGGGGSSGGDAAAGDAGGGGVLRDELTVGQLHARWRGVGPEVQLQYRLLKQQQPREAAAAEMAGSLAG